MSQLRQATLLFAALLSLVAPPARAQLVNDGATNVLSTATNTVPCSVTVGTNGGQAAYLVTNGAQLSHSGDAYIGLNVGSFSNRLIVSGSGSRWTFNTSGNIAVGAGGWGNQLIISDGGWVSQPFGIAYIGWDASASNNQVYVSGNGSHFESLGALVGYGGSGNHLTIEDGGVVRSTGSSSIGVDSTASNNVVVVTGAGSFWSNSVSLFVGESGSGNILLITNGGVVRNYDGHLGYSLNANHNLAVVTGVGSAWNNSSELYVGDGGSFNTLLITNGGSVRSYGAWIGGGRNNTAVVAGAGSVWSNQLGLIVGSGAFSRLLVTDGGYLQNSTGITGFLADKSEVVVTGPGSVWNNTDWLYVGDTFSAGNTLLITNGGLVQSSYGSVGKSSSASNNVAVVSGSGSVWSNGNSLYVGQVGTGNTLLITNGGEVQSLSAVVGFTTSATKNLLRLADGTITVTGGLTINSNNTLAGHGTINGIVTNRGTINVGNSVGSLTINGSLSLGATADMVFEISGLLPTNQHDIVTVTNFVEFAGTLSLSLLPGFLPEAADSFALMSFASSSGGFANVSGGRVSLTNNLASFAVTLGATNLVLSGVQYVDTDGDGQGDLQEQAAGTDAADPTSALAILSVTLNGAGHSVVRFQSVPGQSYRVEYSDNFATWSAATGAVFTNPLPGVTEWVDDGTLTGGLPATSRAYRIGLQ